jgi:hypothetical protein
VHIEVLNAWNDGEGFGLRKARDQGIFPLLGMSPGGSGLGTELRIVRGIAWLRAIDQQRSNECKSENRKSPIEQSDHRTTVPKDRFEQASSYSSVQ